MQGWLKTKILCITPLTSVYVVQRHALPVCPPETHPSCPPPPFFPNSLALNPPKAYNIIIRFLFVKTIFSLGFLLENVLDKSFKQSNNTMHHLLSICYLWGTEPDHFGSHCPLKSCTDWCRKEPRNFGLTE